MYQSLEQQQMLTNEHRQRLEREAAKHRRNQQARKSIKRWMTRD